VDLRDSPEEHRLRLDVREWLAGIASSMPVPPALDDEAGWRRHDTTWQRMLFDAGYAGIDWPVEFGGVGAAPAEHLVFLEELSRANAPAIGVNFVGQLHAGPTLMVEGTQKQREEHLPAILRGNEIWCQGFSEPEAGSDLAGLRTRAVRDGDDYVVTGQKIWTSYAAMAQWCILAARVGEGTRHEGITMFVVPMDSPGITVRPIRSMLGAHHLNEVFFDDVLAAPAALLGEVGGGWSVIRTALAHERVGIARYARCERLLSALGAALAPHWGDLPASLHTQWARALVQVRVARLLAYRTVHAQATGEVPDVAASAARIAVTQCDQAVAEVLFDAVGHESLDAGAHAPLHGAIEDHWRYAQAATVASGTIEVQRMIVSKALLAGGRV